MMNITRRQALRMGLIPLLISVVVKRATPVVAIADVFGGLRSKDVDPLEALFTDAGPAREVGRRYLATFPDERNPAFLRDAVTERTRSRDVQELRALLARKRERDFRTGDIAIVDGWVLSRTEARACALVALL